MELTTHYDQEHHHYNIDHVLEHCNKFIPCLIDCSIDVQLESEATPFVEDSVTEPRQQGKQPPFDHVDKNRFPTLSLMHESYDHLDVDSYRIVQPISFA